MIGDSLEAEAPLLRISKLTDYGIVLLAHLAAQSSEPSVSDAAPVTHTAREMAEATGLPLPVVSKMLKTLSGADLLHSHRGAKGGYSLARRPREVSVAEIIERLEGPIALMECSLPGHCEQEPSCAVSAPWQRINRAVESTLRDVSLADLAAPARPSLIPPPSTRAGAHDVRS